MSAMNNAPVKATSAVHTVYKTADGKRVPSASTILGVIAKPALIKWAWRLGTEGVDMDKYVDKLAAVGTLAHLMIMADIHGSESEARAVLDARRREFSPEQVDLAENSFLSYLQWRRGTELKPFATEFVMVSETHRVGGTLDFFGLVNGVPRIIDFKSGKGIYSDHFHQVAGYRLILKENMARFPEGTPAPEGCGIVNVPRSEDEAFDVKMVDGAQLQAHEEIFLLARSMYEAFKRVGK